MTKVKKIIILILLLLVMISQVSAKENLNEVIARVNTDGVFADFSRGDLRQLESDVQFLSAQLIKRYNEVSAEPSKMNFGEVKVTFKNRLNYIHDLIAAKIRLEKEMAKPVISSVRTGNKAYSSVETAKESGYRYGCDEKKFTAVTNDSETRICNSKVLINSFTNIRKNNNIRQTKSPDGETLYTNLTSSQLEKI